jgi:hypothetical protein
MSPSVSSSTPLGMAVLRVSLGSLWIAHALALRVPHFRTA